MCAEWLATQGYTNILINHGPGRDIDADMDGITYWFEVKSSRLKSLGSTVMFSEMDAARQNRSTFRFLICQGNLNDTIDKWNFEIVIPDKFILQCYLSSPLFQYGAMKFGNDGKLIFSARQKRKGSKAMRATWEMVERISKMYAELWQE